MASAAVRPLSHTRAALLAVVMATALAACASSTTQGSSSDKPSGGAGQNGAPRAVDQINLTAMQEDNDSLTVKTNFAEGGAVVLRVEGQRYESPVRDGTSYTFRSVKVPKLGVNNAKLVVGDRFEEIPFKITRTMTTIDEYRKYAQPINYPQLSKAADRFAGTYVKGRGQVYQIQEEKALLGGTNNWGGINVINRGYGVWDGNIRFNMPGTTDIVQGDIVSFYGKVRGSEQYDTFAGGFLIAPYVDVSFMEK
jgi:hypothetical protein